MKRLAVRLTPTLFIGGVLAASFVATPLGPIQNVSTCGGYLGAPVVSGVSPTSGRESGFDVVTITGCGFTGTLSVHFGANAAEFNVVSDTKLQAATPAHAPGTVDVTVTNGSGTSATSAADHFTYVVDSNTACQNGTISPSNSSQPAGSEAEWVAGSTTCDHPLYEFWIRFLNGKWYLKQAYSINPIFDWDSSGFPPGAYYVVVHVKQSGHAAAYETYAVAKLMLTGCTSATLSQPSTTSHPGVNVTFTATSSTCPDPVYRFWIRDNVGHWHLMQTGSGNTWTWHNTGWGKGSYRIVVWVNQDNSYMGRPQTYAFKDHVLN